MKLDIENKQQWSDCMEVSGVRLPTGYYFGISSSTGELSDIHDVISVKVKREVSFYSFFFVATLRLFFPSLRLLIWILNIHSFGIFINFARCTNWKIKESTTLQRRRVIQPKLFPPLMRPRGRGHITTTAMLTNGIKDKIALLCRGVGHCCCCKQLQSA